MVENGKDAEYAEVLRKMLLAPEGADGETMYVRGDGMPFSFSKRIVSQARTQLCVMTQSCKSRFRSQAQIPAKKSSLTIFVTRIYASMPGM